MKFEIHSPCERLKPYVKHFIVSESGDAKSYNVLPGTALVMGFQYHGKLSYIDDNAEKPLASAGITGLTDAYRTFKNTAGTGSILVVFHETGAAHFFSSPLNELFRLSLSLDHLFSRGELAAVAEQLHFADSDKAKISIIEQLLKDHLVDVPADMLVHKALQYIYHSKGVIRIGELAKKLNTSQSPLEKRFRRVVGASPKKFASIVRVKNVMYAINRQPGELIYFDAGYYDQAHFIKEFKAFTAVTPEQFFKGNSQPADSK